MSDLTAAALELAASGLAVFPVGPDKAPRTPRGFHDATTDPTVIQRWDWNGGGGIGMAVPDGTVIIDVDPRNGGSDTMKALREEGLTFPATRIVRTRSGGFHYYFTVPEDLVLRAHLGEGIDVKRAGKGYVLVPPSPGYTEHPNGLDAIEAPAWLTERLAAPKADGPTFAASEEKFFQWEDGTAYGLAALEREITTLRGQGEGGRNDALNRATFALAQLVTGGELRDTRAWDDLESAAADIGLEEHETTLTMRSAWEAGGAQPRQAPPREAQETLAVKPKLAPMPTGSGDPTERRWVDWDIDEPPPPFFLHPIIPRHAYVLVYGATEASKSMVLVGLAAQGSHVGVKTSVYSLENPPHTDRDRLRRLKPHHANFRLSNDPLDFNDPRQLQALVEDEKAWGADIIIIDTYSHAFNSHSEDGNAKAIEFARRVRYVMAEVDCSVVVIDHTGYTQADEPRDASAKRQQVDVAILMSKRGEWQPGQPARFSMVNKKAARFANPFFKNGEIQDGKDRALDIVWTEEPPTWV